MSATGTVRVYRIAWDGELSMSGQPHPASVGTEFGTLAQAQAARDRAPGIRARPGIRIESRLVSSWERVPSA